MRLADFLPVKAAILKLPLLIAREVTLPPAIAMISDTEYGNANVSRVLECENKTKRCTKS